MSFFRKAKVHAKRTVRNLFLLFLGGILGLTITLGAGLYYFRHWIISAFVTARIYQVTGFRTEVKELHHEFPAKFTLRDVKMYAPEGFAPGVFASSPYFYIELDLPALIRQEKFHIPLWKLMITELHLEKNKEGIINGVLLKSIKQFFKWDAKPTLNPPPSKLDFFMTRLEVRVDHITYQDRTGVLTKKISSGLKLKPSVYENVEKFGDMIEEMEDKVLRQAGPSKIVKLSPFYLESSLKLAAKVPTDLVAGGSKVVRKTPEKVTQTTEGLFKTTKETFEDILRLEHEKTDQPPAPAEPLATPSPASQSSPHPLETHSSLPKG